VSRWAASVHQIGAGLRVRFDRPLQVLELTPQAARELAAVLIVVAARVEDEAENGSHSVAASDDLHERYIAARCRGDEAEIRELEAEMGGDRG
jgi:hypothetical protein